MRFPGLLALQVLRPARGPYKFYGPHAGVLYGRAEAMAALDVPKLDPAPDTIPDRVETGTQNHEGLAGLTAAAGAKTAGLL